MDLIEQECIAECWGRIRSGGRRRFIVEYGLRRFALQLGLSVWLGLFVAVPVFFEGAEGPDFGYVGSRPFWLSLLASLVLWPIAGYVWALWEWRRREMRFHAAGG